MTNDQRERNRGRQTENKAKEALRRKRGGREMGEKKGFPKWKHGGSADAGASHPALNTNWCRR